MKNYYHTTPTANIDSSLSELNINVKYLMLSWQYLYHGNTFMIPEDSITNILIFPPYFCTVSFVIIYCISTVNTQHMQRPDVRVLAQLGCIWQI